MLGERTHYFRTDISSKKDISQACEQIVAKLGSPTILIANAGLYTGNTILDASENDLRRTFDTNVLGTLFCIQSFLPAMIVKNHGHVVVVSSIKAYLTTIKAVDYAASKAAFNTIVEGLQTELKHVYGNPNVKVSGVYPAIVKTKMSAGLVQPVNSVFMPVLEPEAVADHMLQILQSGQRYVVLLFGEVCTLWAMSKLIRSDLAKWLRCRRCLMLLHGSDHFLIG